VTIVATEHGREDCVERRLSGKLAKSVRDPGHLVAGLVLFDASSTLTRAVQIGDETLDRLGQRVTSYRLTGLSQHSLGIDQGVAEHISVDLNQQ